ncbi:MAG: MATE family efflux transporter [Oscillospiraceae bacterium]|nr:MATE family efflux transporter [Oscillospiraceae bacterium]
MRKSGYQIDMLNGPLAGKLLLFALPLMLSSLLQLLFNAADVVVVGRYVGKQALAAVGSNTALINLLVNVFTGLSVGANVIVARDLGAEREEDIQKSVHTSLTLALFSGLLLAAAGTLLARTLLELTSSPEDVIDLAAVYLKIYFCGMPANMLYNFGSAILRAQGDTRRPLYFLTLAGVVNVALNLLFVIGLQMSVAGVALATITSQYISAALVLYCLVREKGTLHFDVKKLGLDRRTVKRIVQVGLPAGFQGLMFSLSNVVIQSSINSFASTVVAGSTAAGNIEGFVYVSMNAFYQSALTFTSQNYGAGECRRVDRVLLLCLLYSSVTGMILGGLAVFFGHELASIYAPGDEAVIGCAVERLRYVGLPYFLCGVMEAFVGVLRGIGYSVVPMVVTLVGACGLRLVWVATVFRMHPSPAVLYISYPISWIVTAAIQMSFLLLVRKHAYAKVTGIHGIQQENPAP